MTKNKRRMWPWSIVGIIAVAFVLACGGGGGGTDTAAEEATAKIGQAARDGNFEFTVTKIKRGKTKVGDEYLGKKAQGEFVFAYVTVKNIGDESQMFFGDNQKLISKDGKEFSADSEASLYVKDSDSLWEEINPGNRVKGIVVFDVPKGTKLDAIVLHDSAFSGGVKVAL